MIEIIDLEKSFNGTKVLNGVNLKISDNEVMTIIGKSGGGKSVLLKHLVGLISLSVICFAISYIDITQLDRKELDKIREKFGMLFQSGALFDSLSVYGNIAFPLKEKTKLSKSDIREKVLQALDDVGLRGMGNKYPDELSGGMKKRVALARTLITEPTTVLFDEPTTGLDPIILNSIHRLIMNTHKKYGFTGLVISHEIPEIFEVADKVAMLLKGTIIETGTPEEIQNSSNPAVRQFITGSSEGPIGFLS